MNQLQFRLVFSRRLGMRVAVSEVARSCGRAAGGSSRRLRRAVGLAGAPVLSALAWALALPLAAPLPVSAQTARPPVVFASQLGAPRQPLPQPYGSTRRADGSSVNDPSRRSFIANPAHAGQVRWTVDGQTATLDQGNVDRLVLNWDSFDIGAGHKVHFKQDKDPARYVSALNRIWSADPSVILGSLTADREVVLLNPNGVYFGRTARVDTGKFVASALGIADSVFERGLRNITNGTAVFSTDGTDHLPTALVDSDSARSAAISVEAGAELRSAAGGDVLLVAPRVVNAGRIVTPQGQAVLAAGSRVYLMSSSDPAQRGLIVAVDPVRLDGSQQADPTLGTVENRATGSVQTVGGTTVDDSMPDATSGLVRQINEIRADRGSINLVGLTVRQNGQANATTAVQGANGAIYLQAMAGTTPVVGSSTGTAVGFGLVVETGGTARIGNGGGTVALGSGSTTAVLPDASLATQIDAEMFNRSRIRIEGGAIAVAAGASVVAPAGQVDLLAAQTALTSPLFNSLANTAPAVADASRITIAPGAQISVAGLQDVAVDGARFQGSQRLFRIELADAPAQRSTPLYRSEVFFDLRQAAQLAVADVSGAAKALPRTVQELSTAGGSLRIEAEGAVVVGAGAQLDVSGGSVKVTETTLQETLLARGGRSLAFSEALAARAVDAVASTRSSTRVAGYTEGRAGGSLQVSGRQLVLAGDVRGSVVQGDRQAAGTDPQAAAARLGVGRVFGVNRFHYLPVLDLAPGAAATPAATFWADPLGAPLADLPAVATLSLAGLGGSTGFGALQLSARTITQTTFGVLDLGPGGSLVVDAETLALDGHFQAAGGQIALATTRADLASADAPGSGDIVLSGRSTLDVAGRWTNASRGSTGDGLPAADGGSLAVSAARSLLVAPGARLDVSGGATLSANGRLATGEAGSLDLAIGRSPLIPSTLQLEGVQLQGFDFGSGGTLRLGTPGFTWGASAAPSAFSLPGAVLTGVQGFGNISVSADGDVRLASGTQVAPVLHNWLLDGGAAQVPSGAMSAAVARSTVLDGQLAERAPVNLSLSAALPLQPALGQAGGSLVVERGASILLQPGASLTLQASRNLTVGAEGGLPGQVASLQAPGGTLVLRTAGQRGANSLGEAGTDPAGFLPDQALWLGADARLSTSGTAVLRPAARADVAVLAATPGAADSSADDPRLAGRVLGGGQITLDAQRGYLVAQAGSAITLDGAQARVQLPGQAGAVNLASPAGQLTLRSAEGMALEGTVSAAAPRDAAGRALADGGRLTVELGVGGVPTFTQGNAYPGSLVDNLQGAPIPGAVAKPRSLRLEPPASRATAGVDAAAGVPVDWLQALDNGIGWIGTPLLTQSGFDGLRLGAGDRIQFDTAISLHQPLGITLDAPALAAAPGLAVALGGSQVTLGDATAPRSRVGAAPDRRARADDPATAATTLTLRAETLTLVGDSALQGFNSVAMEASGDLRLTAVNPQRDSNAGSLAFASDLLLQAAQITATGGSAFSIDGLAASGAADRGSRLLLRTAPGGAAALPPLSALGAFNASATTIDHDGVLRQPFGSIGLQAERDLLLGARSITAVTGQGAAALYGSTNNLSSWVLPSGAEATALPVSKRIRLQAASIDSAPGALVDAQAGGSLLAWEFFPGVGGSQDTLAANGVYAVLPDHAAAPALALSGGTSTFQSPADGLAGQQLVITQPGGGLAPGAYTLVPARWALLHGLLPNGAHLVQRASDGSGPLAPALAQDDGSVVVSGYLRAPGSVHDPVLRERFELASPRVFNARSEQRLTDISNLLARQASASGLAQAPELPRDGGQVQVQVQSAAADAVADAPRSVWQAKLALGTSGAGPASGRAGTLDLSAASLALVDEAAKAPAGALAITTGVLAGSQAGSVLLGALRSPLDAGSGTAAGFSLAGTLAQTVVVDIGSTPLRLEELVLASAGTIDIAAGTQLQASASGTQGARRLQASGDGALAVVSANALDVQRSGVALAAGNLAVGAGATLAGAQVSVDATGTLQLAPSVNLSADALAVSARRINLGTAALPADDAVSLAGVLLDTVRQADALTLRSYSSIDFAGTQDWAERTASGLPAAVQRSLVLDAPALRGVAAADGSAVHTDLAARNVELRNTSGQRPDAQASGTGSLVLQALPSLQYGRTGGLLLGPGEVRLGFDAAKLRASGDIVFGGTGATQAQGDVTLQAARVTARTGASQALVAEAGALHIGSEPGSHSLAERVGQGAQLRLQAQSISQAGHIDLPGGALTLQASGAAAGTDPAILFAAGSRTSVAGFATDNGHGFQVFGQPGSLLAVAGRGAIALQGGLDASAAPGASEGRSGGDGGRISLRASGSGGALLLDGGALQAAAGAGATDRGGVLRVDVARLADADPLVASAMAGGITGGVDLRVRQGDLTLARDLAAQRIQLAADTGNLALAGAALDARAPAGGVVVLAAGGDVQLDGGSSIDARSGRAGANGGDVLLSSRAGRLRLDAGATVQAGGDDAADGRIVLRAARGSDGRSVAIDPLQADRLAAGAVALEAVQVYRQVTVGGASADITAIAAGNSALAGTGTSRTGTLGQTSVGSDSAQLQAAAPAVLASLGVSAADQVSGRVRLAPGVDVQATGDLTLGADWPLHEVGRAGEAGFLSLRAGGNLVFNGSISDGFASAANTALLGAGTRAWSLRLAAGADLGAAAPLAVAQADGEDAPPGDLLLNAGRLLRTGAGSIELAASRDIRLAGGVGTNTAAAQVYVAGRALTDADGSVAALFSRQAARPQFTEQGGRLELQAGRDIVAPEATQLVSNWLWRTGQPDSADSSLYAAASRLGWWPQFNRFRQTLGAFGGGNLVASAGRDVLNLQAFAPTQGWADNQVMADARLVTTNGGDLSVLAGRDLLGGQFLVGAGEGRLDAGGALGALAANVRLDAPALAQMSGGQWQVQARGDAAIVGSFNPTAAPPPTTDNRAPQSGYHYTWGDGASLALRSLAGDAELLGGLGASVLGAFGLVSTGGAENLLRVLPPVLHLAALGGAGRLMPDDSTGALLFPAAQGALSLWAAGDLVLGEGSANTTLAQADTDPALWPIFSRPLSAVGAGQLFTGVGSTIVGTLNDTLPRQGLQAVGGAPVRLEAGGSVVQPALGSGALRLAEPAEIRAGADISNLRLVGQHAGTGDVTTIVAARNYLAGQRGAVELVGPGALDLQVGGDLDLGSSDGIRSTGNLRNARLPAQGAALRLAAAANGTLDLDAFRASHLGAGDLPGDPRAAGYRAALVALVQRQVASAAALDFDTAWQLFRSFPAAAQAAFGRQVLAAEFGHVYLGDTVPTAATVTEELQAGFAQRQADLLAAGRAALQARQRLRLPGEGDVVAAVTGRPANPITLELPVYGDPVRVPAGDASDAVDADKAAALAKAATIYFDALAVYLDRIAALRFEQIDTADQIQTRLASRQAAQAGWRDAVARQFGVGAASLDALPATDTTAQAWRAALQTRSGPLFESHQRQVLQTELASAGSAGSKSGLLSLPLRLALYDQGFLAAELAGQGSFVPQAVWPSAAPVLARSGALQLTQSVVLTERGGDISLQNPGGGIEVGLKQTTEDGKPKGVIALGGGNVFGAARDDFQVNTQRVQVIGEGNLTLWSSSGDIDSGRGANTAVAAPPLAARRGVDGVLFEVPAGTAGSGIAILANSAGVREGQISLYPAFGEILALDAFIRGPRVELGSTIQGADNAPDATPQTTTTPTPPPAAAPPSTADAGAAAASASTQSANENRSRTGLLTVDLLGLGEVPIDPNCSPADEKAGKCRRPTAPAAAPRESGASGN